MSVWLLWVGIILDGVLLALTYVAGFLAVRGVWRWFKEYEPRKVTVGLAIVLSVVIVFTATLTWLFGDLLNLAFQWSQL